MVSEHKLKKKHIKTRDQWQKAEKTTIAISDRRTRSMNNKQ
jgi:hypothetical protein